MKKGILFYDHAADRYDIEFNSGGYYNGLHCGTCFEVFINGKWLPTRIEKGSRWYLCDLPTVELSGLCARI